MHDHLAVWPSHRDAPAVLKMSASDSDWDPSYLDDHEHDDSDDDDSDGGDNQHDDQDQLNAVASYLISNVPLTNALALTAPPRPVPPPVPTHGPTMYSRHRARWEAERNGLSGWCVI